MAPTEAEEVMNNLGSTERVLIYGMGALGKPLSTKIGIQKLMFLCSNAIPEVFGGEYSFQPHKMGPYSEKIDESVLVISNSGLVGGNGVALSARGDDVYRIVAKRVKEPLKSTVDECKEFILGMTDDEIMAFIYTAFPDYRLNSEEWSRLEANRANLAASLVRKGKVSASRAAEIAGMNYYDFEDLLRERNIRWKS